MARHVVIVAGGSGSRMKHHKPKQFIELNGKPILQWTIERFFEFDASINLILVLPAKEIDYWQDLRMAFNNDYNYKTTPGGKSRVESVRNGLALIEDESDGLVAIHDGVRPFTTIEVIKNTFDSAENYGSGVAAVSLKDSIRMISDDNINEAVKRDYFKIVQTPQTFKLPLIKDAYRNLTNTDFTDDASVAEKNGERIMLVEGNYKNIKITTPEDLLIAQAFAKDF
ncbi:MAG TPA: 2-C-methyl-D-erythritol 4-phosphate cytidylyltransferase [Cyclobacteriaceae bacterium]